MKLIGCLLLASLFAAAPTAQSMAVSKRLKVSHISTDFPIGNLNEPVWTRPREKTVSKYWSGTEAPGGRHFKVRLLWSNTYFYVRFDANQTEPLVVNDKPDLSRKTIGLWNRDVCEIFIAPNKDERNKYFEFEIAPTGEWIDLGIQVSGESRETDWEYSSGMESAVKVEKDKAAMAIKIPWKGLGKTPKPGDVWSGNLFRCVGKGRARGYLAWQPTGTKEPSFHVPSAFGEFEFVSR